MSNTKTKKKEILDLIEKTYLPLDPSGLNRKSYREKFNSMSDEEFKKFMNNFFKNEDENFYLEITPFKSPKLDAVEKSAKALGIDLEEYVYLQHDGRKDDPIRTQVKVPVGYLLIKRTQQIIEKKNTYTFSDSKRNMLTNQVSNDDKISRMTDVESATMQIYNSDAMLKELLGPRADDSNSKMEMKKDIARDGYTSLQNYEGLEKDNVVLKSMDYFLIGMGLNSDLITDGEILQSREKELLSGK